jgi:hypothetical protein
MLKLRDFFGLTQSERISPPTPFSYDFQRICALITHLGAHEKWQSRPPSDIAFSLAMDKDEVSRVLNAFPCFFRKSGQKNNGEELFTVHLRYARRKEVNGVKSSEPMNPEEIGILINILMQMVSIEKQESRFVIEMRENNKRHEMGISVAIIVALISAISSLMVAILK